MLLVGRPRQVRGHRRGEHEWTATGRSRQDMFARVGEAEDPLEELPTLQKRTAEDSLTPAHTSEKRWAAQTGGPVSVRLTRVCSCGDGER